MKFHYICLLCLRLYWCGVSVILVEERFDGGRNLGDKRLDTEFIVSSLRNIFGVSATKIILNYMEKKYNLAKNQIPDNIEDFYTGLNSLLGKKASTTLQRFNHAKLGDRVVVSV